MSDVARALLRVILRTLIFAAAVAAFTFGAGLLANFVFNPALQVFGVYAACAFVTGACLLQLLRIVDDRL